MEKVAVIGAGLVGSLQAIYLAQRGFQVEVYERRPDMRKAEISAGRSINLALSERGWRALEGAGVAGAIRKISIPMKGRMMHSVEGDLTFQPYGKEGQAIYSVSRGGLNARLMDKAEEHKNVQLFFNEKCEDVDIDSNEIYFLNSETGEERTRKVDRIFGTDGAFSAVRARLQKTDRFDYSQQYLKQGYKELMIPAHPDGSHQLEKHALHIWPRGEYMLIALANLDGSFTCTLFFPFEGRHSFSSLQTENDVLHFFDEVFPDALALMPTLKEDYFTNPTSSLVTIRCSPWNVEDRILLMGDAAHAIVPFFGQGMNSGFEDCTVLHELIEKHQGHWAGVFPEFSAIRMRDADAIADLALRNFVEMRDKVADPAFLLQKKIEKKIHEKHPDKWVPLYSMVTFHHQPYSAALKEGDRQEKIMREIMALDHIEDKWDSEEVEQMVLELLEK